ncbi:Retrovirus-related Pol polyprotein from transposon 17.6, partial [Mucuna pruriens]
MHAQDEAKTTIITEVEAYCYKVMPFRLKNAGATYQRLMDKIFKGLIREDVEVYIDDMVVKSTTTIDHCEALERVFQVLRRHQLKLNPEKCSFGVQARKFLGYMLIERGIESNPKKFQAIINIRSPRTMKEVQQLTGRITTLSRFLSRSVEATVPIFKTLKKGDPFSASRVPEVCESDRDTPEQLHSITSPWPFYKWGVDILGPFPPAPGQVKYLIVAVDYFTKRIEVEPVATISLKKIKRFYWRKIIYRFGLLAEIAKTANKVILRGLRRCLKEAKERWADELLQVLWSYHMKPHSSTNETPFA